MKKENNLFDGLEKLTRCVETRNHAINIYNDFAIKYNVKHKQTNKLLMHKTFERWVDLYWVRPYNKNLDTMISFYAW